ncbi:MAG: hypothetical protein GY926_05120 [bacterium]|nr:hypothetical protein [bacterium]
MRPIREVMKERQYRWFMVWAVVGALAGGVVFDLITGSDPGRWIADSLIMAFVIAIGGIIGRERQISQDEQKES